MQNKTLIVANSEFTTLTRSKAFLIGLAMMPLFMALAVGMQKFTRDVADTRDHPFVVVDRTGVLYDSLKAAADEWNQAVLSTGDGVQKGARFLPSQQAFDPTDVEARAALSDRVRRDEIFAFVEIPKDALDPATTSSLEYYSNHPSYRVLPAWIESTLNREILNRRFRAASIDRSLVASLTRRVGVSELGLLERDARGGIKAANKVDRVRTMAIPMGMMMILLFSVMSGAPQLLNSVLEEKMSRISEVLVGSVTPFELMMGKLLGAGAVSVFLAAAYIAGGVIVAHRYGYADAIRPSDLVWLMVFLTMAVFMFGSIFISIGAACSDLKDAQGMMTPAMLIMMLPWMTWFAVVNAPESPMATGLSLFPTATPFLMLLRIALPPGPPLWQVALSFALTTVTTVALVYAAGKIFRTGLLMQGKAPTFGEMWKWVRAD
jgi:ABC-2 type transport system permease protein